MTLAVLAVGLQACGDDDPGTPSGSSTAVADAPRGLTADEADRLAVTRFANYRRGTVPFTATVPVGDQTLTMSGSVDFREHRAIAAFATSDQPPSYGALAATFDAVGLLPTETEVPADQLANASRLPASSWQTHAPSDRDPLDQVFLVLLNLGFDRTENAQLLRQNGGQWLGETEIDGVDVDLLAAAPEQTRTLTYYVDDQGNLLRADVATGEQVPATITFGTGEGAEVPVIRAVGRGSDGTSENAG